MKEDKIYFANLDSIRFIAAMMVFLQHGFRQTFDYLPIKNSFAEKLLTLISTGGTGVSIFFVLSGFLITYLLISEHELSSGINLKNFYIRRILRIWPLYFAVVFFAFILYPGIKIILGANTPASSNIFYHLVFLSNFDALNIEKYFPGHEVLSQNINWSVSIEEQFYLFWPLIFTFLSRKHWMKAIVLVIAGSLTFRIFHSTDKLTLYFHTFSVLVDLGIGGLFALIVKNNSAVRAFFEKTGSKLHLLFFGLAFLLLYFEEAIFNHEYIGSSSRFFISTCFALIITSQALSKSDSLLNLKNLSFASKWGKYTYGIYLLHPIVINMVDVLFRLVHIQKGYFAMSFMFGIICFVLTLLVSKWSYTYFESKFLNMKDRFTTIKTHV